jgi:hypothetical protein
MVETPENDFETWSSILIAIAMPGGEFSILAPDLQRIFASYCSTGFLPDPITSQTDTFVDSIFPSFLSSILNNSRYSSAEFSSISDLLESFLSSCTIAYKNNNKRSKEWILTIFNLKSDLYLFSRGPPSQYVTSQNSLYPNLVRFFISNESLDIISNDIQTNPTFESCTFLLKLVDSWGIHFSYESGTQLLRKLQKPLQILLSNFSGASLRVVDAEALSVVVRFLGLYLSGAADPLFTSFLWKFADLCFRSDFVDKQIIGTELISKMARLSPTNCTKWAIETQLLEYVITVKIHEKVMALLAGVPLSISARAFPVDTLVRIYGRLEQSHSSEKSALRAFLANALSSVDEKTFSSFLSEISNVITSDLLSFLVFFTQNAPHTNKKAVRCIVLFLLELTEKGDRLVDEAITKLCNPSLSVEARSAIQEYVFGRLHTIPTLGPRMTVFRGLIKSVVSLGETTQLSLVTALVSALENENSDSFIFLRIIKTIVKLSYIKLPEQAVAYFFLSDRSWKLFAKLLKVRGFDFLDAQVVPTLFEKFRSLDFAALTLSQCQAIIEASVAFTVQHNHAESPHDRSYVRVVNADFDWRDLIVDIFVEVNDAAIVDQILKFILKSYASLPFTEYLAFFTKDLRLLSKLGAVHQRYSARVLHLFTAMLLQYEKFRDISSYKLIRHKPIHRNVISIIVDVPPSPLHLHCKPSVTGDQLTLQIATLLRVKQDSIYLKFQDSLVSSSDVLGNLGIQNGSTLSQWENYPLKPETNSPSICLTGFLFSHKLIERVYELIQRTDLSKDLEAAAWKFLMWMPTVSSVFQLPSTDFLHLLEDASTELHLRYLLQIAIPRQESEDIRRAVLKLIVSGKITTRTLFEALLILDDQFKFANDDDAAVFCDFLLTHALESRKYGTELINAITHFANWNPPIAASCFISDPSRFIKILSELDPIFIESFIPFFPLFGSQKHRFFNLLVSNINVFRNDRLRLVRYFQLVSAVFDESCDTSSSLAFCLSLVSDPTSPLFPNVCGLLLTIFTRHRELCSQQLPLFDTLLDHLFRTKDQAALIWLIDVYASEIPSCASKLRSKLSEQISVPTDRWSYDPSSQRRFRFAGLRNLGATCYMNAVFQQLFHTPAFRARVVESPPGEPWHRALRSLFVRLQHSELPFVNTQQFVEHWRFYGERVDPRQQQDAVEFFQCLMDTIGDDLFKGRLIHRLIGDGVEQSQSDDFWSLSLEVKGCRSFAESLSSFLQTETITGYRPDGQQRTVDVRKFTRISKTPDFLVIHLKRYEWDVTARARTKVNDRFEFPPAIDLAPLMENSDREPYTLTGVVLHSGTALGGHYTSYVLIDGGWVAFDDTLVREIGNATFSTDAFGGQQFSDSEFATHYPCAYLLFYARHSRDWSCGCSCDPVADTSADQDLIDVIGEENREFMRMQAVFTPAVAELILRTDDAGILVAYLFNVFAHSNLGGPARRFAAHFLKTVGPDSDRAVLARSADICAVFTHCGNDEVCDAFVTIVEAIVRRAPIDDAAPVVHALAEDVPLSNWRALPNFFRPIVAFADAHNEHALRTAADLIGQMQIAFESAKSVFLQSANFSVAFEFIARHRELLTPDDIARICAIGPSVLHSPAHGCAYMNLVRTCADTGAVVMGDFIEQVLGSFKNPSETSLISLFLHIVHDNDTAMRFLRSPRISREGFFKAISQRVAGEVRRRLLDLPKVLFTLITCNVSSVYDGMEKVFLQLFPNASELPDYPCAENWEYKDSFVWVDSATNVVGEDDIAEMAKVVDGLIEGCVEMCEKPSEFLSGPEGNTRQTPFLRVVFWLLLRSRKELREDQTRKILGLFTAFRSVNLVNDANVLELIRLVQGLPTSAGPLIGEKFMEIAEAVLTATFSNANNLEAGYFVVFFDTFGTFLARRPTLANTFVQSTFFKTAVQRIVMNTVKAGIKHLLKFTSTIPCNVREIFAPHLKLLPHRHPGAMREIVGRILENGSDDECYTEAVTFVLSRVATTLNEVTLLVLPIARITMLSSTRKLLNADNFQMPLRAIITQLQKEEQNHIPHIPATVNFLVVMSKHSEYFREVLLKVVSEVNAESGGLLVIRAGALWFNRAESSGKAIDALVGHFVEKKTERGMTEVILTFLGEVIRTDGFEECERWITPVFRVFYENYFVPSNSSQFLKSVAQCTDGRILVGVIADGREVLPRTILAANAGAFARVRPDLKSTLLQAAAVPSDPDNDIFQAFNIETLRPCKE